MYIIGEKLNSSIPRTGELMRAEDFSALRALILAQAEAGASCLDINTAMCGEREADMLAALCLDAAELTGCDLMPDSSSAAVLAQVLPKLPRGRVILNSVTLSDRLELAPLAAKHGAGVVALPIERGKVPATADERCENALRLCGTLTDAGVAGDRIFIDALVQSVALEPEAGPALFETVLKLKRVLPEGVRVLCGLSNVSFGLPERTLLNCTALAALTAAGLDAAILDAANPQLRRTLAAAGAFAGRDEYCMDYIGFIRGGTAGA